MKLHTAGEDYLEAVLILQKKLGMVRSVDVARYMEVSKPSVCYAVGTLREGGFLTTDEKHYLHLTELGQNVAEKITSARVPPGAHFTFAVRFFCTLMATIPCFFGIILQIGLKWNSLLFGQLARLSALYMPADILLGSCAAVEHIP